MATNKTEKCGCVYERIGHEYARALALLATSDLSNNICMIVYKCYIPSAGVYSSSQLSNPCQCS